ncbi:O-acyltransferase like protein-like [Hydractinia symbiolongicarpus]|uniref:O-acyltransferase like protein-like n=1 Tax=Hydractinia symbiolongicarpus TaxID=13093 RepID=UPI00254B7407|nr:O-acyltransferase like protein-like [Hydractinia symbiolongicarpus]
MAVRCSLTQGLYLCIILLVQTITINSQVHLRNLLLHMTFHHNPTSKVADYNIAMIRERIEHVDVKKALEHTMLSNNTNSCLYSVLEASRSEKFLYFDASGKIRSNIKGGNVHWFGSYQECMDNRGSHYCAMSNIKITNIPVLLGLCMPEICEADDVTEILTELSKVLKSGNFSLLTVYRNNQSLKQYGTDAVCYDKEKTYSTGAIVMISISAFILLLCVLGSITEIIYNYVKSRAKEDYMFYVDEEDEQFSNVVNHKDDNIMKENNRVNISMHTVNVEDEGSCFVKFLLCFSLIKNTKTLFDTTVPPGAITCINGIRTLSITWVIQGHVLVFGLANIDNAASIFATWLPRFTMQTLLNAPVSVDSFFFLSGLLVGYLSMKRFELKGNLPLLRYYLHRYIRLTPSYAFLIFFATYVFPIIADGPFWFTQAPTSMQTQNCVKYWWTNLLYINNFYPDDQSKMCYPVSWYLANDMQFYVISPIILWCMYKFKWIGVFVANGSLLLASLITNGALMYKDNASPVFYQKGVNLLDPNSPVLRYQKYLYEKPWTRIMPYLVGLVLGYVIMQKHNIRKFKYPLYSLGWFLAVGTGIACVYGPFTATQEAWNQATNITYGVMFRFVWALALAWVVYACHNGYGGLVNDFLSWKAFIPLSRLTYSTYLTHAMVILLFFGASQTAVDLTLLNYVYICSGITVLSFAAAYIVSVCIEYPVFNLEKLLYLCKSIISLNTYLMSSLKCRLTKSRLLLQSVMLGKEGFIFLIILFSTFSSPVLRYQKYLYEKPWTRIMPYLVGLVLGYVIMQKHNIRKFKYPLYSLGWFLAVGTGIACVYGPFTATQEAWNQATNITYGVMFRFVWALALAWVVYACHNGYGGLVNDFLSWKAFIPLSRLTYSTYLTHAMVILLFFGASQTAVDLTLLNYVYICSGITVLSFAAAYIVSVCIEYPVFNLEKLLLKF